jgi:hypothetical protein
MAIVMIPIRAEIRPNKIALDLVQIPDNPGRLPFTEHPGRLIISKIALHHISGSLSFGAP